MELLWYLYGRRRTEVLQVLCGDETKMAEDGRKWQKMASDPGLAMPDAAGGPPPRLGSKMSKNHGETVGFFYFLSGGVFRPSETVPAMGRGKPAVACVCVCVCIRRKRGSRREA